MYIEDTHTLNWGIGPLGTNNPLLYYTNMATLDSHASLSTTQARGNQSTQQCHTTTHYSIGDT